MDDKEKKTDPETEKTKSDQPKSLRRSWKASGPVAKVTAICAVIAAIATVAYAVAAWLQWNDTRQYFERDQRPWIEAVMTPVLPIQEGVAPSIEVEFINRGKTPAVRFDAKMAIETVQNGNVPKLDYGEPIFTLTAGILFPGIPISKCRIYREHYANQVRNGITFEERADDPLAAPEFEKAKRDDIFFVFYGKAGYADQFGIRHETSFCGFWEAAPAPGTQAKDMSAKKCTDYNHVDSN